MECPGCQGSITLRNIIFHPVPYTFRCPHCRGKFRVNKRGKWFVLIAWLFNFLLFSVMLMIGADTVLLSLCALLLGIYVLSMLSDRLMLIKSDPDLCIKIDYATPSLKNWDIVGKMRVVFLCILVVLFAKEVTKHSVYKEIPHTKGMPISFQISEMDGQKGMVLWEATFLYPMNGYGTIRVWDEIGKAASFFDKRRWRNGDQYFMGTTPMELKVVCSCTPLRSITDYREYPPEQWVTRQTAMAYFDHAMNSSQTLEAYEGSASSPQIHENCKLVQVQEMIVSITEYGESDNEIVQILMGLAEEELEKTEE